MGVLIAVPQGRPGACLLLENQKLCLKRDVEDTLICKSAESAGLVQIGPFYPASSWQHDQKLT